MHSENFRVTTSTRSSLANIVLVTNAFVWYYLAIANLYDMVTAARIDQFMAVTIWSAHFGGIAFSAVIGATLVGKLGGRTRFLTFWMMLGTVASLTSIVLDKTQIPNIFALSLLYGVSLGIGMPSCMGYFTETIKIENRGRVGGIALLLTGVCIAALRIVAGTEIGLQTFVLSIWRTFGLIFFLLLRHTGEKIEKVKAISYKSLFSQRPFILYLVPWIMFSLITYLTTPIQSDIVGKSTVEFMIVIENVLIGVFAIVGGFLSDSIGRKRIAIVGFALLGTGYSVLGIYHKELFSWYFYTVVDGIAWGMLFVIFVVNVWGDLSHDAASDKYYAVGVLPFFISKFLQLTIGNEIANAVPASAIFSFTAFFLFLAVLPLVYAPETLPEKTMKDRELAIYVAQAQKVKEKHS